MYARVLHRSKWSINTARHCVYRGKVWWPSRSPFVPKGARIMQADSGFDSDSQSRRKVCPLFISAGVYIGGRLRRVGADSLSQTVYWNHFLILVPTLGIGNWICLHYTRTLTPLWHLLFLPCILRYVSWDGSEFWPRSLIFQISPRHLVSKLNCLVVAARAAREDLNNKLLVSFFLYIMSLFFTLTLIVLR
jgi:hypothetical protein